MSSEAEIDRVLDGARATWKAGIAADEATRERSERRLAEVVPQRKMIMPLAGFAVAAAFAMVLLARRNEPAASIVPEPRASLERPAAAPPEPASAAVSEPTSAPAETTAEPPRLVHPPSKSVLPPLPPPPPPRDERAHYRRVFADRPPDEVMNDAAKLARAATTTAEQAAIWDAAFERMPPGPLRARAATERARAAARTVRHRKTDL